MTSFSHAGVRPITNAKTVFSALLFGVALILATLAPPALADHVDVWGTDDLGTGIPGGTNSAAFWESFGATQEGEADWVCNKIDEGSDSFTLSDDGLVDGNFWRLLVVKAGSGDSQNELHWNPAIGETFQHSVTGNVSHVILCQRPAPDNGENGDNGEEDGENGEENGDNGDNGEEVEVEDVTEEVDETEVLGEVIERPDDPAPTTETETAAAAEELPATGFESVALVALAAALMAAGALALRTGRRRFDTTD